MKTRPHNFLAPRGADEIDDPAHFPWTIGFNPPTSLKGRFCAQHILATRPEAKIGILYRNDPWGKTVLGGAREGLGPDHSAMIVKEASYEVADPNVDPQIESLPGRGSRCAHYRGERAGRVAGYQQSLRDRLVARALSLFRLSVDQSYAENARPR